MKQSFFIEKLLVAQIIKKFPAFYGTWEFIIPLKWPPTDPYPEPDESNPHRP
jgi:hypothetical protein